jgi:outer membrane murein-binding lipoprotein Lpp
VSSTAVAFLGAIAVATVVMALIQVGAVIYAARLAKRMEALVGRLERDVQPMIERLTAMSGEAARAATLTAQQVERVDRTLNLLGSRVDRAVDGAQRALVRPAREGAALAAAVRATVVTLRELRKRRREASSPRAEDEDALFIG